MSPAYIAEMSGMLNWTHFRYFGECRNHSAVLMLLCYSLVVVWLDRIVSPHFSLHKARRKNHPVQECQHLSEVI